MKKGKRCVGYCLFSLHLQSSTLIVSGGQYISCSGSSRSRYLTIEEKFGFFFALRIIELWMMWPPHSMSTRGWLTGRNWIFLRSRRPQNRTSNLYFTSLGRMWGGTGRMGPLSAIVTISSLTLGSSGSLSTPFTTSNISKAASSSPASSSPRLTRYHCRLGAE